MAMKLADLFEAPIVGDSYFVGAFMRDEVTETLNWFKRSIDLSKFDAMIGTGLSGSLIIPILARELDKRFAIVRKGESTHSHSLIEGYLEPGDRWVFVDDFVETGSTEKRVRALVDQELNRGRHQLALEYVGYIMYMHQNVTPNLKKNKQEGVSLRKPRRVAA